MMTKKIMAYSECADNDDEHICPDCGQPMLPEGIFDARMDAMIEVLDGASAFDQTLMLAILTGSHIGAFVTAKGRKLAREEFVEIMDDTAKAAAAGWAQKKREDAAIRRAGSHPDLIPDVSSTLN